jgi:bacterioferritin (cytochrome b1)
LGAGIPALLAARSFSLEEKITMKKQVIEELRIALKHERATVRALRKEIDYASRKIAAISKALIEELAQTSSPTRRDNINRIIASLEITGQVIQSHAAKEKA